MTKYLTKLRLKIFTKLSVVVAIVVVLASGLEATAYLGYELETIASGLANPDGVARVISNGDVYFVERSSNDIKKIPANGGSITTVASGLNSPSAICVDSADNIYFTELSSRNIQKILASDGSISLLVSGAYSQGICVDALNNIFYSVTSEGNIYKISSGGGGASLFSSGFTTPQEVCVDSFGNVYVADWAQGIISKIPASGGSGTSIATGLSNPYGICVDTSGNVYFTEFSGNDIKKILASDGSIIAIADGLRNPTGLSVDASSDDIYFAEWSSGDIRKLFLPSVTSLEVNFTDGAVMAGPVTGKVKFVGNSSSDVCTFSGSATDDAQVTVGKVAISSAAPIASGKSMRLNGGDLIATAGFELPTVAMDQAGALDVNTNSTVGLKTLTGSGALTIATTNSGTGDVHLEDLSANTGGIAACSQPVVIDSATKFPGNDCAIQGIATVSAAPGQASTHNLTFGEIDATSVDTAANSLTSGTLYVTNVYIGTKAWSHDVTAH